MNIRKLKSLLWLTAFLALLLAGYTFWDIYMGKTQEMRYESKDDDHYDIVRDRDIDRDKSFTAGPTSYAASDYEQIWLARIDGSVEPVIKLDEGTDKLAEENKVVILESIEDVVQVGMLLWSSDPLSRLIAVEYTNEGPGSSAVNAEGGVKKRRLHLTEGEPLREPYDAAPYFGKVLSIGQQEVIFQWGEDEVPMTPGLDSSGDGMPIDKVTFKDTDALLADVGEWPDDTLRRDDGSYLIGTNDRDEMAESGDALKNQLNARAVTPTGGGRSSIELTDVKPGSMPARFGFKTGDRIISVNGHPMGSVAEAINWGKNNPNEPQYNVLWQRLGVEQTTVIYSGNQ